MIKKAKIKSANILTNVEISVLSFMLTVKITGIYYCKKKKNH